MAGIVLLAHEQARAPLAAGPWGHHDRADARLEQPVGIHRVARQRIVLGREHHEAKGIAGQGVDEAADEEGRKLGAEPDRQHQADEAVGGNAEARQHQELAVLAHGERHPVDGDQHGGRQSQLEYLRQQRGHHHEGLG